MHACMHAFAGLLLYNTVDDEDYDHDDYRVSPLIKCVSVDDDTVCNILADE